LSDVFHEIGLWYGSYVLSPWLHADADVFEEATHLHHSCYVLKAAFTTK